MSDEERDAIEREMEQCAAEEAARAEAEAEADRAMSDGKVILDHSGIYVIPPTKYIKGGRPVSGEEAQDGK